jgi:hypothetical protein
VEYSTELVCDIILAAPTPSPLPPLAVEQEALEDEIGDDDLDAEHDDAPLWVRSINDVIGDAVNPVIAHRVFNVELNFSSRDEPLTFHEAEHEQTWCQAMIDEMKSIEDNKT